MLTKKRSAWTRLELRLVSEKEHSVLENAANHPQHVGFRNSTTANLVAHEASQGSLAVGNMKWAIKRIILIIRARILGMSAPFDATSSFVIQFQR